MRAANFPHNSMRVQRERVCLLPHLKLPVIAHPGAYVLAVSVLASIPLGDNPSLGVKPAASAGRAQLCSSVV